MVPSQFNICPASACLVLHHNNLVLDSFLQLSHMGYDAHQTPSLCQVSQGLHGQVQCILIQRPESLIHKESVQADSACS